jgi:hypothetical protein
LRLQAETPGDEPGVLSFWELRGKRAERSSSVMRAFDARHGHRQKQQNENAAANFKDQHG